MIKKIDSNILFLIIGIIVGLTLAIKAFNIEVDLLGIPYKNRPIIATQDIFLKQNNLQMIIPKGATLVRRDITSSYGNTQYFIIYISVPWNEPNVFETTDKWEYFDFDINHQKKF